MQVLTQTVRFDSDLIVKHDRPTPRYTSYPPATELHENFKESDFIAAIERGNQKKTPLSLYFHIPFCESACYFCGCNVIITGLKDRVVNPYLEYLFKNIEQTAALIDGDRVVNQMHWGGGTPNYLSPEHVEMLWNKIHEHFTFAEDAEISIEVNPRYVDRNYIQRLRKLGFNRISFGIQDFDPKVQEAINRIQPEALLFEVMDWIREANFESVNVDLIYGLPYQNLETFSKTIEKTICLNPDRIAVFNFAFVPWMKPIQKNLPQEALPQAAEKLDIFHMTIDKLTESGYVFIGMDHFAKPDDELAIAQREGKLHRNFQGYTTQPDSELFGFGVTSISMLHDVYVQNHKRLKDFYKAIDKKHQPIEKGVELTEADNIMRREIIMELMCHFRLDKREIEKKYGIDDFDRYFAAEENELKDLENDGLVENTIDRIEVTPAGRLLVRNIAFAFDAYTKERQHQRFSKAI
ncbi:MAG: oxygen-independent coproporphyrinogen III oxidase [Cyanobacteria bacterium SID2]|nr:oxygen-independent coproporphyrinogen III oxidase [Cyanobacteria bacterium SID2]